MTRSELVKMMGSEERADWMMEQILASIKPAFVAMILKTKAEEAAGTQSKPEQN